MDPIISPWFFYWLGVVERIQVVGEVSTILSVIASIVIAIFAFDVIMKETRKYIIWLILLGFITVSSIAVTVFVPDKTTLLSMAGASFVTKNNVKATLETAGEAINLGKDAAEGAVTLGKNFKDELKGDIIDVITAAANEVAADEAKQAVKE